MLGELSELAFKLVSGLVSELAFERGAEAGCRLPDALGVAVILLLNIDQVLARYFYEGSVPLNARKTYDFMGCCWAWSAREKFDF